MSDDKVTEIRARHEAGERASAVDDREWLLGEVERQARHIEELQEKIDSEKSCACSYDAPGDVCAAHSPALAAALGEVKRLRREAERLRAERDTLLLDAREFVRWFDTNFAWPRFPHMRDDLPDDPWRTINDRLNAHADTLAAIDAAMAKIDKEGKR